MEYLVTGGAGLIGSTIVDQLLDSSPDVTVTIVDDLSRGTTENLDTALSTGRARLIQADIRHYDAIRPHFEGVSGVFHQAAIRITKCAEQPRECLDVLVTGAFNVAQACVDANIPKLVAASSASVYGLAESFPTKESHHPYNNRTLYGAAKLANECMYRSFSEMYGLKYVALRYFNVYGPRMDIYGKYTEVLIKWLDRLDAGMPPLVFGDGAQTMDFIYVDDVARANVLAMCSHVTDEVVNVGSGIETSLLELLSLLLKVSHKADIQPEFHPPRAVNPVSRRLADTSKARDLLGFESEISLKEGLSRLLTWRRTRSLAQPPRSASIAHEAT